MLWREGDVPTEERTNQSMRIPNGTIATERGLASNACGRGQEAAENEFVQSSGPELSDE